MALWENILAGLGSLVTAVLRYLDTPFLLISYLVHVICPDDNCECTACRTRYQRGVVGSAERLWTTLPHFVFAPWHLPQKLWHRLFPPPCDHNRCKLRSYITPPPPRYNRLEALYRGMHARFKNLTAPRSPAFPFFRLPVELRYQIYSYANVANVSHTIQRPSPETSEDRANHALYHRIHHALYDSTYHAATSSLTTTPKEDTVIYPLTSSSIVAIHGPVPPTPLLQTCHQIRVEALHNFWATTGIEVHPITSNDPWWPADWEHRPQPRSTYAALREAWFVKELIKVVVRIDLGRLSTKRPERVPRDIGLEECVESLVPLVEELCAVLRKCARDLKVVEICWVDEFAGQVGDADELLRARILEPFTQLDDVKVRIRRLVVAERGRVGVERMLRDILT